MGPRHYKTQYPLRRYASGD